MSRLAGIFTFTACALQASAFLLPPNLAQASDDDATDHDLMVPMSTTNAVMQLPCPECAFSTSNSAEKIEELDDEPLFWIQGGANSVLINITVSEDGQRVKVNGETIYPLHLFGDGDNFRSPYVNQVRSGASPAAVEAGTEKTVPLTINGLWLSIGERGGDMLIPIEYRILELSYNDVAVPVSLDQVTIKILDLDGGIMIADVVANKPEPPMHDDFFGPPPAEDMPEDFPFHPPPPEFEMGRPEFGMQKECNMLPAALCKLRNIIEAKIMGMGKKGGCHGRKGGRPHGGEHPPHVRPHFRPDSDEHERLHPHHGHFFHPEIDGEEPPRRPHHHGRPHHMRPHHHRHYRHHFMHAFTRGLAAVLIPTMAGIAVGMTVSLVGLIVGRLIGFLWIKLYRGGRRGYASVALDESIADAMDSEKEVVDEEALPVYESAPAYEDTVTDTK